MRYRHSVVHYIQHARQSSVNDIDGKMWPEIEAAKKDNKRELKLSGVSISERFDSDGLDASLFELNSLNLLTISDTSLQNLPSEISNLTNLQTLLLYGNELKSLPKSFGLLEKLKVLDVSRNQLESIPDEIANLTQLTTINLSNNALKIFPSLPNSIKLSVLDLSNNKLTTMPDICYDDNTVLADIYIKGNSIENIPGEITRLASLKHLNLAGNKIKTVPKVLAGMAKLKGGFKNKTPKKATIAYIDDLFNRAWFNREPHIR